MNIILALCLTISMLYFFGKTFVFKAYVSILILCLFTAIFVLCFFEKHKYVFHSYVVFLCLVLFAPTNSVLQSKIDLTVIPFSLYNLKHGAENVLLFFPLGYLLEKRENEPLMLVVAALLCEALQLFVAGRVCDVKDVIFNLLGGVLGYLAGYIGEKKCNTKLRVLVQGKSILK